MMPLLSEETDKEKEMSNQRRRILSIVGIMLRNREEMTAVSPFLQALHFCWFLFASRVYERQKEEERKGSLNKTLTKGVYA
jgi:hypothetical protein